MRKAVVILSPNNRCQEDVERGDFCTPLHFSALLKPFAVLLPNVSHGFKMQVSQYSAHLVDHGVNDVNEWLIAVQQAVTATKDVAFQPALACVFR